MKTVKLSVREFAVPSPRTGSLESDSGYGGAPQAGIEIHQRVQDKRKVDHSNYTAEVKITTHLNEANFALKWKAAWTAYLPRIQAAF